VRRFAKASFAGSNLGSGIRRGRIGLVCLFVLGLAAFLGSSAPSAGAQACPNEGFRNGPSAHLPDCRAYEMVSPPEKEGYEVDDTLLNQAAPAPTASPNGNTILWSTERGAFGEVPSNGPSSDFLSRRGASWSYESIMPPLSPYAFLIASFIGGATEDFSKSVTKSFRNHPPLTPESSENSTQFYLRDNNTGSYRLLSVGQAPNLQEVEMHLRAISLDAGHVIFDSPSELTGCGGPSNEQLCDWSAATGALSLVGVLPGGGISAGEVTLAGPDYLRPLSADGSRIYFHEGGGGECGVCVRINGATTQLVSETGSFQVASSDGSIAYVTDGGDLLRWDGGLTNLTGGGGEVKAVLGASADGSRVYFVAGKELAPGATAGENNLYLWTQGAGFQFITGPVTLTSNWDNRQHIRTSRVTPDGMHLAFTANNSLTGFPDNGKTEAYLYSAATGELVCASCVVAEPANGATVVGGSAGFVVNHLTRNLSDDGGRLFFTTEEALVPQDVNGVNDVYEYDAAGGAVGLISTGTDPRRAFFGDASAAGTDAVFITREQLVPLDTDTALDVYDARVNGGLASQHPAPPEPPCTGKGCRGESSSPDFAAPAAAVVVGKGNVSQRQNCNKLGREAKKLSNRAKKLRRHAKQAKRNGKSKVAKKRNRKATRLAKRARNKSKSAKRCRKANRRASK
jgi:hypothetical protein